MVQGQAIFWAGWQGNGVQQFHMQESEAGLRFEGAAIDPPSGMAALLLVETGPDWIVRRLRVRRLDRPLEIALEHDGRGSWRLDGRHEPTLDGAMEPDISITPLTNSFPIRRLRLPAGENAEIRTAYVELDTMQVFADRQRYTCIAPGRLYRYEAVDGDFKAEIELAADGFVETYPPLFRRLR